MSETGRVEEPCPQCGRITWTYCHFCGQYLDDMMGSKPAKQVSEQVSNHRPPSRIELTLPWDVLASDNLRTRRRGDPDAQKYRAKKAACELAMIEQVRPGRPLIPEGEVRVRLDFYPPDRRERDETNFFKAIFDSMEGIVYQKDRQIAGGTWERRPVADEPRCEIEVLRIQGRGL